MSLGLDKSVRIKCVMAELSLFYYVLSNTRYELNVCKEITSTDLNDKTIASVQPNLSPRRYNSKL